LQYINCSGHPQLFGFSDIAIDSSRGLYEIQNQPAYNDNAVRPVGSGPIYTFGGGYTYTFQLQNQLLILKPEFYSQKNQYSFMYFFKTQLIFITLLSTGRPAIKEN